MRVQCTLFDVHCAITWGLSPIVILTWHDIDLGWVGGINLGRVSLVHGFELVAIGVDDEGGVVTRAVLRSESWRTVIATAGLDGCGMKCLYSGLRGGLECEMESRTSSEVRAFWRAQLDGKPVVSTGDAITNGGIILPDTSIAEGAKGCVVECLCAIEISGAKRNMAEHDECLLIG